MLVTGKPCKFVRHSPTLGSPAKRVLIMTSRGYLAVSAASAPSGASIHGSAQ